MTHSITLIEPLHKVSSCGQMSSVRPDPPPGLIFPKRCACISEVESTGMKHTYIYSLYHGVYMHNYVKGVQSHTHKEPVIVPEMSTVELLPIFETITYVHIYIQGQSSDFERKTGNLS